MTTPKLHQREVIYPESDGKPVGESDDHRDLMFELIFVIKRLLRSTVAYVAGNLFIYYEEGNPSAVVAPDVFVIFGVPQQRRRIYKAWEHGGKGPDLVIELTSADTRAIDLGEKRVLYAELGVQEYYLFDPLGDYLKPSLRGYELVDGELLPMPGPRLFSQLLGVELRAAGRSLRLYEIGSGLVLPTPDELDVVRHREAEARQREAEVRRAVEAEVEQLRTELERLRRERQG